MAFPTAPGVTSYSGTLIPAIWTAQMLVDFYEATCLSEIATTDYEGEIKSFGDKVVINEVGDIEIGDYYKGMTLSVHNPENREIDLLIDKAKYYNIPASYIDRIQSKPDYIPKWMQVANDKMKISIEKGIFADIYADADDYNAGITAGKISGDIDLGAAGDAFGLTKSNVIDYIVDIGTVLDENDAPDSARAIIIPHWVSGMLKKSDLKDASITGDGKSALRTGRLGMIDRFTLYASNCLTTDTGGTHIIGLQKGALTFASQYVTNEKVTNQNDFGMLYRGLKVYGYEVIRPKGLVHGYVTKGSE